MCVCEEGREGRQRIDLEKGKVWREGRYVERGVKKKGVEREKWEEERGGSVCV